MYLSVDEGCMPTCDKCRLAQKAVADFVYVCIVQADVVERPAKLDTGVVAME